jgi:hypothetical protein
MMNLTKEQMQVLGIIVVVSIVLFFLLNYYIKSSIRQEIHEIKRRSKKKQQKTLMMRQKMMQQQNHEQEDVVEQEDMDSYVDPVRGGIDDGEVRGIDPNEFHAGGGSSYENNQEMRKQNIGMRDIMERN